MYASHWVQFLPFSCSFRQEFFPNNRLARPPWDWRPLPHLGNSGFATDRVPSGSKLITNIGKALSFVKVQVFLHVIAVADPNISNGCPLNPIFFHFHAVFGKNYAKHECIPVGYVLPACWPYPKVSHVSRGRGLPNPQEAGPLGCRPHPRRQTPWMQTPPGHPPGHVTCDACWKSTPPPCGQKEWQMPCESITFPKLVSGR